MKDLEKTLGGFIFVNLFPSLQYSIFPLPPGPFVSFLILGKQWTILRTKSENMCVWRKKRVSQKFGSPFFQKSPGKSCNHFCYISLASNSSGLNLYQHMFQNLRIYNLSTFSGMIYFFDVFINQQVVTVQTALPIPHFLKCYMQIVF